MKDRRQHHAFTRMELLVIGLIVGGLLTSMLVSNLILDKRKRRAHRALCVNNLKQIGLGLRMWANDHQEKFPWQVFTNEGGTLEYAESSDVWRHFQAASNELITPKILSCSTDFDRLRTATWAPLSNSNVSYFLSVDTNSTVPSRLLAGDRFVSTNDQSFSGLLVTTNWQLLRTLPHRNGHAGNIVFSDGSVAQLSTTGLREVFSNRTVRLAIP